MIKLKGKTCDKPHIYKITNDVNGKFYYGVHNGSNTLNYESTSKLLKTFAYDKYGKENFTKEILMWFDTEKEAYEYEGVIVNQSMVDNPQCYNLRLGGHGGTSKGRPDLTEEKRKSMANNLPEKTAEFQSNAGKLGGKARVNKQTKAERIALAKKGAITNLEKNPTHMNEMGKKGVQSQLKSGKHMNAKLVECPYGCGYTNNPGNVGRHKKKCQNKK